MTCEGARDLFSALVDEALSPGERQDLEAHLAGCADCRRELDAFQRTIALVRTVPPVRAPAGFVDRVLTAASPVPWYVRLARRLFVPVRLKVPIEAAAVLVIAVVAVQIYRETPELQYAERRKAPLSPASETPARQAAPTAMAPQMPASGPAPTPRAEPMAEQKSAPTPSASRTPAQEPAPTPGAPPARALTPSLQTPAKETAPTAPSLAPPATAPPASAPPASDGRSLDEKAELAKRMESTDAMKNDARAGRDRTATLGSRAAELESARRAEPRVDEQRQVKQDAAPESRAKAAPASPPAPAAARTPASAPTPVDVAGRLAVRDRAAAETALTDLVARLGGTVVARRAEADATVVEVRVPRAGYAELLQGVARIGLWTPERESLELPDQVRLSFRLGS